MTSEHPGCAYSTYDINRHPVYKDAMVARSEATKTNHSRATAGKAASVSSDESDDSDDKEAPE